MLQASDAEQQGSFLSVERFSGQLVYCEDLQDTWLTTPIRETTLLTWLIANLPSPNCLPYGN